MSAAPFSPLLARIAAIARAAGEAIMAVYASDFDVEHKDDRSPLTAADLAAQTVIAQGLAALDEVLPVISEEARTCAWEERRSWDRYWLVDPLDGTREFIKRNGEFSVNIALIRDGVPVFGVVQAPVSDVVWHAMRGDGAWRREGGREDAILTRRPPALPLRVAASRSHRDARTGELLARMGEIELVAQGSSLKFCRIAEGTLDVYPRLGPTSEWDTAAGQCVLEAAGGVLLAADTGEPFHYNRRPRLLNGDFIALGDPSLPWRDWLAAP